MLPQFGHIPTEKAASVTESHFKAFLKQCMSPPMSAFEVLLGVPH